MRFLTFFLSSIWLGLSPQPLQAGEPARTHTAACSDAGLGWHFYCDPEDVMSPLQAQPESPRMREEPDPVARLASIRTHLDALKARAIMEPTPSNVRAYIAFQTRQLDRAALFSDMWRRVIWQTPDLDYSLFRPTGTLAKRAWLDERRRLEARTLASLNERYGVFYFFRGEGCEACRAAAPVVRAFADHHGIDVMAISIDGTGYPEFPNFVTDQGEAERLGISEAFLPALALFDSQHGTVIPVGHGVIAADELSSRIYALTALEPGEDY